MYKYYKNEGGEILGFPEDGSQDEYILESYQLLDPNDLSKILAQPLSQPTVISNMWKLIKQKRSTTKLGGIQIGAYWFHTDSESRMLYLGIKDIARDSVDEQLVLLNTPILWKTMSGDFTPMTKTLIFSIVQKIAEHDAMCHAVSEQHKAAMQVSSTPEAYNYTLGWPQNYVNI